MTGWNSLATTGRAVASTVQVAVSEMGAGCGSVRTGSDGAGGFGCGVRRCTAAGACGGRQRVIDRERTERWRAELVSALIEGGRDASVRSVLVGA